MAGFCNRRRKFVGLLVVTVAMIALVVRSSRPQAQRGDASPQVRHALPVADAGAANGTPDMGSTYYYLEGKATRVTTRYKDGSAVASRSADGDFRTELRDLGGNPLSDVSVQKNTGLTPARIEFSASGGRVATEVRPAVRPTLDWANAQAYALWRDRAGAGDDLEWQGRFVRSRGGKAGSLDDLPVSTEAEFDNGVQVSTARNSQEVQIGPQVRRRPTFISRVTVNGAPVGVMRWYANERVLAWDYPGLSRGFVNPERLKSNGGWTFTPTLAWAGVQGMAFYEFHSRLKARGSIAGRTPNLFDRALSFLAPTVSADAGCDGLHYLDGSVFRACCDTHDKCYERSGGCGASSWYWVPMWGSSWQCSVCNTQVTMCFLTGGLIDIDYQNYW